MKRCIVLLIILLIISTPHKEEIHTIPNKVYAKGKPKHSKKKTIKSNYEYLGEYTLTAYCGCRHCSGGWGSKTSTGTTCKAGKTIAVDPKVIPYGSTIRINGHDYTAEDCGGAIKGNRIDVYFDSHSDALEFGRQKAKVYLKKPPKLIGKLKKYKINKYARRKDNGRKRVWKIRNGAKNLLPQRKSITKSASG